MNEIYYMDRSTRTIKNTLAMDLKIIAKPKGLVAQNRNCSSFATNIDKVDNEKIF